MLQLILVRKTNNKQDQANIYHVRCYKRQNTAGTLRGEEEVLEVFTSNLELKRPAMADVWSA